MATIRALSNEDRYLNNSSIVTTRERDFLDVDLSFEPRPSGDVYKKLDASAVRQAIKTILLTNRFEKPFQPTFGANLQAYMFDLADDDVASLIRQAVTDSITAYEPRASILNIEVTALPDNNTVRVDVEFMIINTQERVTLTTVVSRLR